jgi:F-type H+-transporting ATPase subunit b
MSVLGIAHLLQGLRPLSEEPVFDKDGHVVTHSWIWPEFAEIIYGGVASIIIFWALWKFAGPQISKAMKARTERIQKELDSASADVTSAAQEAATIRQAKGDIAGERDRLLAEADVQAESILTDGRARLAAEVVEIEAKAQSDIAAAGGRVNDELRAEIARLSSAAVEHVVTGSLDEATHQALIEDFIQRVGASA